jgi:class 3 adenylate cyclase
MPSRTFHYRRQWALQASPAAIWPFIANSHRLNYDWGNSELIPVLPKGQRLANGYHQVRASIVEFVEEPFQWVEPYYHRSFRRFRRGQFFDTWRSATTVEPLPAGGSLVTYEMLVTPGNLLGWLMAPLMLRYIFYRGIGRSLPRYEHVASSPQPSLFNLSAGPVTFAPGGRERLAAWRPSLLAQSPQPALAEQLLHFLETADEMNVTRFRPYALADLWSQPRRAVLELCLLATRLGLLEFSWELLCPLCRGAQEHYTSLGQLPAQVHCDTCNIDFTANLDRSVELLFNPNPAIRPSLPGRFCVGSPQVTPHIVMQQLLRPGERRQVEQVPLAPGRYRLRLLERPGYQAIEVMAGGHSALAISASEKPWPDNEVALATQTAFYLTNETAEEQLFILERAAWSDQAATAAEVTALQLFRDLFAREVLRSSERVSVGSITVLFTNLRETTRLYRSAGDINAYGQVVRHFEVVRQAIAAEGGTVVKAIGDSVMAVFTRPVAALQAMHNARQQLANPADGSPPLFLRGGVHYGPCIAVNLNDRLDYFGSTVNLASRLEGLSSNVEASLVFSAAVRHDPEVAAWLEQQAHTIRAEPFEATIRGFEEEAMALWQLYPCA